MSEVPQYADRRELARRIIDKGNAIYEMVGIKPGEGGPRGAFASGYKAAMDDVVQMLFATPTEPGKPSPE